LGFLVVVHLHPHLVSARVFKATDGTRTLIDQSEKLISWTFRRLWHIDFGSIFCKDHNMTHKDLLFQEYNNACNITSDIHEHLPALHEIANRCTHVTEFGVRSGMSSRAILSSRASKFMMYDLVDEPVIRSLVDQCKTAGMDVSYIISNVLDIEIEPTEFLFIDTWHTYAQLSAELYRHAHKVKRFIAFHDTITFGLTDESDTQGHGRHGLLTAIIEYLIYDPNWRFIHHNYYNNGFTVLERNNI
jgi:hypothetical protein